MSNESFADIKNIKCFVKQVNDWNSALILLHKDARFDMDELDKRYGPMGWKDEYTEVAGNLYCTISVWDQDKKQWISKSDVGVESYIEKEKGQASDAFKRAGTKWNIGRFLYTAPDIWIKLDDDEVRINKGTKYSKTSFYVNQIVVKDEKIVRIMIDDDKGNTRFRWGYEGAMPQTTLPIEPTLEELKEVALEKVKNAQQPDSWKAIVTKGMAKYDLQTVKRLLASDRLKEE
jgi:hypothetical protein